MPKKYKVLEEFYDYKHSNGGLYCLLPFDELDSKKKGIFKVGITTENLSKRIEDYHTYFPMSLTIMAIIENPPVPKGVTRLKHYQQIEKDIFNYIVSKGGYRLKNTANLRNAGDTEWFYTTVKIIHDAFQFAYAKYGGSSGSVHDLTQELIDVKQKLLKPHYLGKIIYPLEDPDWAVYPEKKKKPAPKKPKKSKYDREQDSAYKP